MPYLQGTYDFTNEDYNNHYLNPLNFGIINLKYFTIIKNKRAINHMINTRIKIFEYLIFKILVLIIKLSFTIRELNIHRENFKQLHKYRKSFFFVELTALEKKISYKSK